MQLSKQGSSHSEKELMKKRTVAWWTVSGEHSLNHSFGFSASPTNILLGLASIA